VSATAEAEGVYEIPQEMRDFRRVVIARAMAG